MTAIATAIVQERLPGDKALLPTPLNLIFPDNAFLPVRLALDPVLKCATCLRKLPDHLVAPLASAIFAEARGKVQVCPTENLCIAMFCSSKRRTAGYGGTLSLTNAIRFGD